jgi:hypothetical protein
LKIVDLDGCSEGAGIQLALHFCEEFAAILPKDCHLILDGRKLTYEFLNGGFKFFISRRHFDCLSVVCRLVVLAHIALIRRHIRLVVKKFCGEFPPES